MRYLSVCSGVEAATVAWHGMGWTPVAFSEIEKFPSQVLKHHYPSVQNMGDMTKFEEWNLESVELLVGGTPCQSFSVAGLRKGLDDPRGNLMLTYGAIAKRFKPKWLVWENVPGVLSSNGGRDFGTFLGMLAELGYGFAYRVLDAQYFGVAQRRKRVFVVGHFGDWRRAASVLFERQSLRGDTAPSRKTSQDSATTTRKGIADVCPTIGCELAKQVNNQMVRNAEAFYIPEPAQSIAFENNRRDAGGPNGVGATDDDVMCTLTKADVHGVAQPVAHGIFNEVADTVTCKFSKGAELLQQGAQNGGNCVYHSMAVRRLTPVECERLQGFPDGYTNIRENCPDGPRYKALGNSMAVPVMRWIGQRIGQINDL